MVEDVTTVKRGRFGGRAPRGLPYALVLIVVAIGVTAVVAPSWLHSKTATAPTDSATATPTASDAPASPSANASVELSASLQEASATPLPAKCESDPLTTSYSARAWLGTRVVVLATYMVGCGMSQELFSVDPAAGQWRSFGQLTDIAVDQFPGDGNSIAIPTNDGGALVIDSPDAQHRIAGPAVGSSTQWGMEALPGGGYLVRGADKLYRIASDGHGVTTDRLPAGYVAVAPTSDPNLFLLAPAKDAEGPYGLSGRNPFRAYLWNLRTGHLALAASSVGSVVRSPDSLAYLSRPDGWLALEADGSVKPITLPAPIADWNSPDGSRYLYVGDPTSVADQAVELRDTATGRTLSTLHAVVDWVVWNGNVAAMVSGSDLVVLDGPTVTRVPLP